MAEKAQLPLYDTDVIWSWNTRNGSVEINLHELERTVVITPEDFRRMTNALRFGTVVA